MNDSPFGSKRGARNAVIAAHSVRMAACHEKVVEGIREQGFVRLLTEKGRVRQNVKRSWLWRLHPSCLMFVCLKHYRNRFTLERTG